jgi:hypothetical protein
MNKSANISKFSIALAKAHAEMPAVNKNSTNPFLKNKYADLGAVIEVSRPILAKYELAIVQSPVSDGEKIGLTTLMIHSSGEFIEDTIYLPISDSKGLSVAQSAGVVISYLRRYALQAFLNMYADEDIDGNSEDKKVTTAKQEKIATKPNEIITASEWENFEALVKRADEKGIKHPAYERAKMDAGRLNGVSNWIKQELEKVGK